MKRCSGYVPLIGFPSRHARRVANALILTLLALLLTRAPGVGAHPLGYLTVNQYARIEVESHVLRIVYVLDLAEIPAFQEVNERLDADGGGDISDAERAAYVQEKLEEIRADLHLTVDGREIELVPRESELSLPEGQARMTLLYLRAVFVPSKPVTLSARPQQIAFTNNYEPAAVGWREILVTHGPDVALEGVTITPADLSDELRSYPEDPGVQPPDQREVRLSVALRPGTPAAAGFDRFAGEPRVATEPSRRPGIDGAEARLASLVNGGDLTTRGIVLALCLAAFWGAAHALSPGHGKTLVGAYLVGSRGTPRHAAFLGLTVTITHTIGVIALGLVTVLASAYVVPADLMPWLGVASGALVVALGLHTLRQRLSGLKQGHTHAHTGVEHDQGHHHHHDDSHGHSHLPPGAEGGPITWRGLLALGVSGGLVPCPSALVVLLGAIALGRAAFGLALVVAFSLGLAATLTVLGLLFLYAGRIFERRLQSPGLVGALLRVAPAAGAVVLTIAGLAIALRALGETGAW